MTAGYVPVGGGRHGGRDFRGLYQRHAAYAFLAALMLHAMLIGAFEVSQRLGGSDEAVVLVRLVPISRLGPPPSIANNDVIAQVGVSFPPAKIKAGIPVPVPDPLVKPDATTIASQTDLHAIQPPAVAAGDGGSGVKVVDDRAVTEADPDPRGPFVPVEKYPQVVRRVPPDYPELALKAGVSGKVIVRALVDKEGRVKRAFVEVSDNDVFNDAAVKAALQWVFTPAMMNDGPVAVWITVPFKFVIP